MTIVRVRGFQIFRDRFGKMRCYHRATRTAIDLDKARLGSVEFLAECKRVADIAKERADKAAVLTRRGTLGALICDYRQSTTFQDLAARTRADYQGHFDYLRDIADTPLATFSRPLVVRIRDKAAESKGRRFGNYLKATLSVIFGWGCERGYLASNPAMGIKAIRRPKGTPDANRPWADAEREAVLDGAPDHMRPALALMMFTGLGPKDALTLPRNFVKSGEIATRRAKTGEPVFWPMPKPLAAILDVAPSHDAMTLCANSRGLPWTQTGFNASWRTLRVRLETEGRVGSALTLYGLRHTVAVILRESGADERTIADALGQKTIEMARHYAKGADLRGKMKGVVKDFESELAKRRTKTVKPSVKP
jgi:integrase